MSLNENGPDPERASIGGPADLRSDAVCRVCGDPGPHRAIVGREMMNGSREEFGYFECSRCGCVQIEEIPEDLGRHYAGSYCSFQPPARGARLKRVLKSLRTRHAMGERSFLGGLLLRLTNPPRFAEWMLRSGAGLHSAILDVGCGAGHLLRDMHAQGFTRLVGVDPFLDSDVDLAPGLVLRKREIQEMDGRFHLVMFHHSFEHLLDPRSALMHAYRLLEPGGVALIRIPVAGSLAWRRYGAQWVQLDPPRHIFLHTVESLRLLAEESAFRVERVDFDSDAFQFWGSEQYRNEIPLFDPRSYAVDPRHSSFSSEQIREFEAEARRLNARGEGDSACFYLRRDREPG